MGSRHLPAGSAACVRHEGGGRRRRRLTVNLDFGAIKLQPFTQDEIGDFFAGIRFPLGFSDEH